MELTNKQQLGLQVAVQRFKNKEKYTCISGYAGSGKSTLVKFIVQSLPGIDPDIDVVYATFTGKAAQVLLKREIKMYLLYINFYMSLCLVQMVVGIENL